MTEIRLHGRRLPDYARMAPFVGAGRLLAEAALAEGKHVQFRPPWLFLRGFVPEFAVVRVDAKPIDTAAQDYRPDLAVAADAHITAEVDVAAGLKSGGAILVNAAGPVDVKAAARVVVLDLDALAARHRVDLAVPLAAAAATLSGLAEAGTLRELVQAHYGKGAPAACEAAAVLCSTFSFPPISGKG